MPNGKSVNLTQKPSSPPRLLSEHLNHVNMQRATIPSGQRRARGALPKRAVSRTESKLATHLNLNTQSRSVQRRAQIQQQQHEQDWIDIPKDESTMEASLSSVFDDMEGSYGDAVSQKGIAVMKLVEQVTVASEARDQQEKDLMLLRAKVEQYKNDFERLNERLLKDKVELFDQMESLRRENELLRSKMVNRAKEEGKSQRAQLSVARQSQETLPNKSSKMSLNRLRRTSLSRRIF